MADRSGGSETYESIEVLVPKAGAADPNPPNVDAARALLACDFAVRLLMAGQLGVWQSPEIEAELKEDNQI